MFLPTIPVSELSVHYHARIMLGLDPTPTIRISFLNFGKMKSTKTRQWRTAFDTIGSVSNFSATFHSGALRWIRSLRVGFAMISVWSSCPYGLLPCQPIRTYRPTNGEKWPVVCRHHMNVRLNGGMRLRMCKIASTLKIYVQTDTIERIERGNASRGKRSGDPKPVAVATEAGIAMAAVGRTKGQWIAVPGTTAKLAIATQTGRIVYREFEALAGCRRLASGDGLQVNYAGA
jgi:hypothetical protein